MSAKGFVLTSQLDFLFTCPPGPSVHRSRFCESMNLCRGDFLKAREFLRDQYSKMIHIILIHENIPPFHDVMVTMGKHILVKQQPGLLAWYQIGMRKKDQAISARRANARLVPCQKS